MAEIGSNGPVFDPKTGDFLDNPYETAKQSKNITELRWVPLIGVVILAVLVWIGFTAMGWPFWIPIVGTIVLLLALLAIPWISNTK